MDKTRITLSMLWTSLMLTYLLGDVMRIFSGDFIPGEVDGMQISSIAYLGMAALMLIPILMIVLTLVLPKPAARWTCIIISGIFFAFNAVGLPTYASSFDQFLIAVGLIFNLVTVWYAWGWAEPK